MILTKKGYNCGEGKKLKNFDLSNLFLDMFSSRISCSNENNFIELREKSIKFSCENFNGCELSTKEFANEFINRNLVSEFEYNQFERVSDDYIYYLDEYCGRGVGGDKLCVRETINLFSGLTNKYPNEVTIEKGMFGSNLEFKIETDNKNKTKLEENKNKEVTNFETYKLECEEIGFTPGTEKFGDCIMKMMDLN